MQKFASIEAVKSALNEMGVKARLNVISGRIDVDGSINGTDYSDDIKALASQVQLHLSGSRYEDVEDSIMVIADENRYNPVQEMLDETTRDGEDHISDLLEHVMGLEAKPDQADLVKRWLHQTMALAFNGDDTGHDTDDDVCDFDSGHDLYGADGLLVLVGEEGCGKTLLLSKLAVDEDLFLEGAVLDVHNKDNVIENTSCWITELCDVDNLTSSQSAFITKPQDTYRPHYEEVVVDKPRKTSFCATANRLPKPTKATKQLDRRLWIVDANNFDLDRIQALDEEWFKQLWKQVYEELYLPNPEGFYSSEDKADTVSNSR